MAKRIFDLTVATLLLVLSLPVLAMTALAILLTMGRPILFRQLRPGLHGRPFEILKFRTMVNEGPDDRPDQDALRLTRLGRFLRNTSIDELPQLWNVIRGDMSLVGPRPQLMRYYALYSPWHRRRHEALPGITGLAQIRGRNAISWDERLDLDVWYVDHRSFWLDLKILFQTLPAVIQRKGITAAGRATMVEFQGSSSRAAEAQEAAPAVACSASSRTHEAEGALELNSVA